MSDEAEAAVQRGSMKKLFWKFPKDLPENTCARVSFLIYLDAVVLKLHLKQDSSTSFSVSFAKFVTTDFLQNDTDRILLIIAV